MRARRLSSQNKTEAEKYKSLCRRIALAKANGFDYKLSGAREISLYVHRTEARSRQIFRTGDLPIERLKAGLRMSVSVYEWYIAERQRSAILGEDFHARLRRIQSTHPSGLGPVSA